MNEWPGNVTHTKLVGSQRGAPVSGGFDAEINAYLALGWRILQTYVEDKQHPSREECVCLLGWAHNSEPQYPSP